MIIKYLIQKKALIGIFLFSVLFVSANSVSAQSVVPPPPCYNITGHSTPLSNANVNEGQMDFDRIEPFDQYKGCVQGQDIPSNNFLLKGWVWNSNLGWISLGSFDEPTAGNPTFEPTTAAPYTNRGIDTGLVRYSSQAVVTRDASNNILARELYGYWWGDNIGWIRLNSKKATFITGDVNQPAFPYSVIFDAAGNLSGYGWSDNLGWVNMAGVKLDLLNASFGVEANIQLIAPAGVAYANGASRYQMKLKFSKGGNDVTQNFRSAIFCVLFTDNRLLDTVNLSSSENRRLGEMTNCNEVARYGSTTSNFSQARFVYDLTTNTFMPNGTWGITSYVPAAETEFKPTSVKLTSGGTSYVAKVADPVPSFIFNNPNDFKLLVASTVTATTCNDLNSNPFKLTVGVPTGLSYCGIFRKGAKTSNPQMRIRFVNAGVDGLSFTLSNGEIPIVSNNLVCPYATGCGAAAFPFVNYPIRAQVSLPPREPEDTSPLPDFSGDLLNVNIVTENQYNLTEVGGNTLIVRRPGPFLNQALFRVDSLNLKGGIDDRAFVQLESGGAGIGSSGGFTGGNIREKVIKEVYNAIKGGAPQNSGCINPSYYVVKSNVLLGITPAGTPTAFVMAPCIASTKSNVYRLTFNGSGRTVIKYSDLNRLGSSAFNGGPFFTAMNTPPPIPPNTASAPKTLVIVGADLILDQNIPDSPSNYPAIVLLSNANKRGGYVYVPSSITTIKGYFHADKSIFSIVDITDVKLKVDAQGVPNQLASRDYDRFYNEFAFIGRIISQNTIGGAFGAPYKLGNGAKANSQVEAQPYDLTYFRMSNLGLRTVAGEDPETVEYATCEDPNESTGVVFDPDADDLNSAFLCWVPRSGFLESSYLSTERLAAEEAGSPIPDSERRSVNFIYKAPMNIPIFSKL